MLMRIKTKTYKILDFQLSSLLGLATKGDKMTGFWQKSCVAAFMCVVLLISSAPSFTQEATPEMANPAVSSPLPNVEAPMPQLPASAASSQALTDVQGGPILPHDLSPWGMFMAADWVVKAVMIGLALASLLTWTIWIAKSMELAGARKRVHKVLKTIGDSVTLTEATEAIGNVQGPAAMLVRAAEDEVRLSAPILPRVSSEGVKERVTSRLVRIEAKAVRRLSKGTGILATIGSVAPFVGLFGTVWGIMNSFIGISQTQTTNLAVVAPGIAEALLATAIGLVAAIPAVVIYNIFARAISGYRQLLGDASASVERLVSRELDFRTAAIHAKEFRAAE